MFGAFRRAKASTKRSGRGREKEEEEGEFQPPFNKFYNKQLRNYFNTKTLDDDVEAPLDFYRRAFLYYVDTHESARTPRKDDANAIVRYMVNLAFGDDSIVRAFCYREDGQNVFLSDWVQKHLPLYLMIFFKNGGKIPTQNRPFVYLIREWWEKTAKPEERKGRFGDFIAALMSAMNKFDEVCAHLIDALDKMKEYSPNFKPQTTIGSFIEQFNDEMKFEKRIELQFFNGMPVLDTETYIDDGLYQEMLSYPRPLENHSAKDLFGNVFDLKQFVSEISNSDFAQDDPYTPLWIAFLLNLTNFRPDHGFKDYYGKTRLDEVYEAEGDGKFILSPMDIYVKLAMGAIYDMEGPLYEVENWKEYLIEHEPKGSSIMPYLVGKAPKPRARSNSTTTRGRAPPPTAIAQSNAPVREIVEQQQQQPQPQQQRQQQQRRGLNPFDVDDSSFMEMLGKSGEDKKLDLKSRFHNQQTTRSGLGLSSSASTFSPFPQKRVPGEKLTLNLQSRLQRTTHSVLGPSVSTISHSPFPPQFGRSSSKVLRINSGGQGFNGRGEGGDSKQQPRLNLHERFANKEQQTDSPRRSNPFDEEFQPKTADRPTEEKRVGAPRNRLDLKSRFNSRQGVEATREGRDSQSRLGSRQMVETRNSTIATEASTRSLATMSERQKLAKMLQEFIKRTDLDRYKGLNHEEIMTNMLSEYSNGRIGVDAILNKLKRIYTEHVGLIDQYAARYLGEQYVTSVTGMSEYF